MKIEVAKPDLEIALQVASIGTASTGGDLTTHYVFRQQDDGVEVLSNNHRVGISMPIQACKASGTGDTAFTVEAARLNKWLAAVEDAVLTLEHDGGDVKATSPKGFVMFQSLDPSTFGYWDDALAQVKEGKTVGAKRLQAALSHAKLFVSDKDTTNAKLAVTEITNDSLYATDKGALAIVTLQRSEETTEEVTDENGETTTQKVIKKVPEMADSNLRIHGKDLAQVLAFLSQSGDESVEVKEHDKCAFFVRHDGGVMSVGRPLHAFPELSLDKEPADPHMWEFHKDDLVSAIKALVASASKEDRRLMFKENGNKVALSMTSTSGKKSTLQLELQDQSSDEEAPPLPQAGFILAYPYLLNLLGQWKSEVVRFGMSPQVDKDTGKVKGGWVRLIEDREDDQYLSLLVWLV